MLVCESHVIYDVKMLENIKISDSMSLGNEYNIVPNMNIFHLHGIKLNKIKNSKINP